MQKAIHEGMKTIGIFMAVVCDHSSDKTTTNSQHDVPLEFCLTADDGDNNFIVTAEIGELFNMGYTAVAVLQFDPNMPGGFSQFTLHGLPECLLSALTRKSKDLVHDALSRLGRGYN